MRILNAGCGKDTYGTHFVDFYPYRKNVIKCSLDEEKLPFEDNFFDQVYGAQVFEHLTNPLWFLKEARRVLKKNGELVLITDNAGFYGLFTDTHHGQYENWRKKQGVTADRHYALFTPHHLKNWLRKAGFKEIKVISFVNTRNTFLLHAGFYKILSLISKRFYPQLKAIAKK